MTDDIISNFVVKLRSATRESSDPTSIIERVTPLVELLADDTSWVRPTFYDCDEDQGFGINILHEEPDHTLLVEAIAWLPGRGVAPHDHQTWGVVIGIDGVEVNVDWKRLDDGSKEGFADLEIAKETVVGHGDVVSFRPNDIHGVRNEGDVTSLSLHVYGKTLATLERSEFDPINKIQRLCPQRKRKPANS